MLSLIRREILEKKSVFGTLLGVLFLASAPFLILLNEETRDAQNVMALLFLPLAYLLMAFLQNAMLEDERKVCSYFWSTTPLGKDGIVAAKYWVVFLLSLFLTLYVIVLDAIFGLVLDGSMGVAEIAAALFFLQLFLRSIEMPFIFTLGSKYGGYVKTCVLGGILFLVLVYALFGPLPKGLSMDNIMEFLLGILNGQNGSMVLRIVIGVAPHLAVAAYYISYRLSCRGYRRGVEAYES